MVSKSEAPAAKREFEISMMSVGGRKLRVAVWKAKPAKGAARSGDQSAPRVLQAAVLLMDRSR